MRCFLRQAREQLSPNSHAAISRKQSNAKLRCFIITPAIPFVLAGKKPQPCRAYWMAVRCNRNQPKVFLPSPILGVPRQLTPMHDLWGKCCLSRRHEQRLIQQITQNCLILGYNWSNHVIDQRCYSLPGPLTDAESRIRHLTSFTACLNQGLAL